MLTQLDISYKEKSVENFVIQCISTQPLEEAEALWACTMGLILGPNLWSWPGSSH